MRIAVFLLIFSTLLRLPANADDWPQYRGMLGDGRSPEPLGLRIEPREVWKVDTPLGFSSFSVAQQRVFTLVVDDGRETCLALDAATGNELWRRPLGVSDYGHDGGNSGAPGNRGGDGPRSTPSANLDHVFVYDSHLLLSCFHAESGELVWQRDIAQEFHGRNVKWLNASSPLLVQDTIFVAGGGPGESFLAFEASTGELVWKSGDDLLTHATPFATTMDGTRQVIFFMKSGLVSVDAATGKEVWRQKFPFSVSTAASPVASKNFVYCSAGYGVGAGLYQIDKSSASRVWRQPNKLMNHWSTPVAYGGHLYGIFEFKKYGRAPLQCVELATGEIKWSERGFGPGNCILATNKLIVLSDAGELVVADATPKGYLERSRTKVLDGKCWSTPAFANGRVYVRSTTQGACLDL